MDRRQFFARSVLLSSLGLLGIPIRKPHAQDKEPGGAADRKSFDFEQVKRQARDLANRPFQPRPQDLPQELSDLGYEGYTSIRYRPEEALWHDSDLAFRAQFFHLGHYYKHPVDIYEVEKGEVQPIRFYPEMFNYDNATFKHRNLGDIGLAGFRLHYFLNFAPDMVSFLGASYFRAVGENQQYGLSARGLAIDTGLPKGEEFPFFRAFWLEKPEPGQTHMNVYALLDSKSIAGAFRFQIMPGATTIMNVESVLYPRNAIELLGVAPATSMYLHGENDDPENPDFRPEVHDSDGLSMWRGNWEWVWRPLVNPKELALNSFMDKSPRGYGLLQRDRKFGHYQDDGVYYNQRPNLWVEPMNDWGEGHIHLVEIPIQEEIHDNIVAFWNPKEPVKPGKEMEFSYRLLWGPEAPVKRMGTGHVTATRLGQGGIPGDRPSGKVQKFVIDFRGGDLPLLTNDAPVEPVVSTTRGKVIKPAVWPVDEINAWRVKFDLEWDGNQSIDLRCFLRLGKNALTETWLYQWNPRQV
ncbi:glucan biosynthesis protein [Thiohalorhabdus methylotrophus]|uniref:Glucan biosynthesis protein n=1 Tax=Thiohalorhabdus methylotrophus TaxID=3242694 RepID=A0ABV4TX11_9GAMM